MTTKQSSGWQRFTLYGFVVHTVLVATIAVLAYQGALWAYLPRIPHFDLAGHFVLIGGLSFFLDGALGYRPVTNRFRWLRIAPVTILSLAAIEEVAQALTPKRTASFSDFAADVVGVVALSWLSGKIALVLGSRDG